MKRNSLFTSSYFQLIDLFCLRRDLANEAITGSGQESIDEAYRALFHQCKELIPSLLEQGDPNGRHLLNLLSEVDKRLALRVLNEIQLRQSMMQEKNYPFERYIEERLQSDRCISDKNFFLRFVPFFKMMLDKEPVGFVLDLGPERSNLLTLRELVEYGTGARLILFKTESLRFPKEVWHELYLELDFRRETLRVVAQRAQSGYGKRKTHFLYDVFTPLEQGEGQLKIDSNEAKHLNQAWDRVLGLLEQKQVQFDLLDGIFDLREKLKLLLGQHIGF
ncbi:hypothetical protein SAMN05421823_11934 [Catalinimonas alkaloidigena]|uniref:Uncharacterized protein n=1 Tax=Catalinimonas alkaloidigena TaxID=1075417 RepID=A0A1G9V6P4_9BACT|nr:hypothetical protein [Catalinimonas alkaloidigena]SDM67858.1 hypothetical protein SAMN05421823_11934 [Catalinimonas alkaloidigena]